MKIKAVVLLVFCVNIIWEGVIPVEADGMVFAHYMLYAEDSVDVLKREIQLAQSKGIDAFALTTNHWQAARADAIYAAAKEVGPTFKLFFSPDIHQDDKNLKPDEIVAMLTNYSLHPNQLFYNGKQFFSSWLGANNSWWSLYNQPNTLAGWNDIFQRAGGRDKYFFVPFFPTDGSPGDVRAKINDYTSIIDGLFAWDTSAWPYSDADGFQKPDGAKDRNYLDACKENGKVYMASPSPWFFKNFNGDCQVKGNYQGPGLWMEKWKQLIQLNPPFLEIVTWNDWIESSYVAPDFSRGAADAQVDYVVGFSHRAFLELGEHYIRWYKSGTEPPITEDSLYIFYYTHPKNMASDGCTVKQSDVLSDKLYVTAMLTGPATLELNSGVVSQQFEVTEAGISTREMDFKEGQQSAVLKRGGVVISTLNGSKPITSSGVSNFNVYSTCTKCN